ncbi:hypothetical protein ES702_02796 [subsurface metagenome]
MQQKGEIQELVNIKILLIAGTVIGFLALGGISRVSPVFSTIGQQLELAKSGATDFVTDIKNKTQSGAEGQEG